MVITFHIKTLISKGWIVKYVVRYREIVGKTFIVEANDEYEARKMVNHEIHSGGIDLNKTDYIDSFICECYPSSGSELYPIINECLNCFN